MHLFFSSFSVLVKLEHHMQFCNLLFQKFSKYILKVLSPCFCINLHFSLCSKPQHLFYTFPSQVEPETLAVIKWMQNYNFILSANLHGGAVVANYPFDRSRDPRIRGRTTYAATPDDKIFRQVCSWLKVPSRCCTSDMVSLLSVHLNV